MARPREFDRDVVLQRAMELFWERGGFDRTSISQLTSAMGISAPSLYAAFGGKQGLFDEAVATYAQRPGVPVAQALPAATAREFVQRTMDLAIEEYTSSQHPLGCLINSDPLLADRRDEGRSVIADRLRQAIEAGDLPTSAQPDDLAEFIVVLLNGLAARARDGVPRERLRAVADMALRAWPSDTS
ncbi:TetR/AcrR family transcriptional regulator [Mycolicibacterium hodleri]|uniref:TetR/AcrR family transcriptional regulator n=1 Tax=Mycolicibacterium hodleri TaxID=49897 RepID=A0A502E872_9MYCO|nr:TetR/AcrR family transcriptional regulator [Mycolicibacterium hodleri]TPG33179.1 TetR/AcrR family transcriptional regulator [Mycolicibacterium hodleri]